MNHWTALVPLRLGEATKSRLAETCDLARRLALAGAMARHVCDTLAACPVVGRVVLLAPDRPDWWHGDWARDGGCGLNAELAAFRQRHPATPLLIIHADLPLLGAEDVAALAQAAAATGRAIAPDHAGQGTNALALAGGIGADFHFGAGSRQAFASQYPAMAEIRRTGLSHDLDTPQDLAALRAMGWHDEAPR